MPRSSVIRAATALIVAAVLVAVAQPAAAQVAPATQPPPPPMVYPSIISPTMSTCGTEQNGQPSTCAPAPVPAPTLAPLPAAPPPSPPRPGVALSGGSSTGASAGDAKVLSYFQRGTSRVDTGRAFGFVLLPKSAITAEESKLQLQFCRIMLASLDFMTPEAAAQEQVLVTYWPLVATLDKPTIEAAFRTRDCENLIAWYDHSLARKIAARAELTGMSGPLLITWPSENAARAQDREPLVVDFAKADYAHATKALQYWLGELNQRPELWTSRIREGTIRAELADAINDTAGVMLAVLYGKWDTVAAVAETP